MNRMEVTQVLAYLAGNYQEVKTKTKDEKEFMITSWLDCLKDYEYITVMKAVKELMISNIFMPKIAEIVNLTKQYNQAIITPKLKTGKCEKCENRGLIFYKKILYGIEYQYVARCDCTKGNNYIYDGRIIKDEKNRSNYYIATVQEVGIWR